MAQFRPAGMSDSDSDSDYAFLDKPIPQPFPAQLPNKKQEIEVSLQDAIIHNDVEKVKKIIETDLDVNVNSRLESGWTPLMHACFHAQENIVEYLLANNADPNLHSKSVTAIMAACSNSSANNDAIYHIVDNLIEKGSVINIGDKHGQTPLMRAIASGRVAVVQKLLDKNVNLEMRDQQGWTAVFWAVHHNQPEVLEMLVDAGIRMTEVDTYNRTVSDIAQSHDYQNLIEILEKYIKREDEADEIVKSGAFHQMSSWHDFYPGLKANKKPNYSNEISHLLYGMNCERLTTLFENSGIDLRTFLLMEEDDMMRLGINLPYEKQRLRNGLNNFHLKDWKLSSVAGLYARHAPNYSVLECLITLGTHLQQIYILEATLQFMVREYARIQNKFKYEPPNSPTIVKLKSEVNKIRSSIKNIKKEIKKLNSFLTKISHNNPPPADMIKGTVVHPAIGLVTKVIAAFSVGLLAYHSRSILSVFKN